MFLIILLSCLTTGLVAADQGNTAVTTAVPDNYQIGPNDVLSVTVWNQADVSGKYIVEHDGTFTFPLVGRVTTAGRTVRALEVELTRMLGDGIFKNPHVTVSVVEYRSKRVFLVGELRQPGTYTINDELRLIEALSRAGSVTPAAADHVLVVRPAAAVGPVLPGQDKTAEVIQIDLRSLQGGEFSQNIVLRDGDTVFAPRAATVFVYGHVRSPGSYAVSKRTTVLQALSLAGGATDFGATNRIKIIRSTESGGGEVKAELNSIVEPGDTIIVPERFF